MIHIAAPWGVTAALVAVLLGASSRGAAAEPPPCPSFAAVGARVDRKVADVLALKGGLPLKEFDGKYASRALNFWDAVGADRETVFFVGVVDGSASVSDQVVCRFDRQDRLVSCKKECCRAASRTVSKEQYEAIRLGDARSTVERMLCSPPDSETDKKTGRLHIYYHVDLPVGHHDEGQTVLLAFEAGKLVSKDMSPYY